MSRFQEFSRLHDMIEKLVLNVGDQSILYAPQRWLSSPGVERHVYFKDQHRQIVEAQASCLPPGHLEEVLIPIFSIPDSAGVAGHWNYLQAAVTRARRRQMYTPTRLPGVPNIAHFMRFLELRTDAHGRDLLSLFHPPVEMKPGLWAFHNRAFDPEQLPTRTAQPWYGNDYSTEPEWVTRFHGIKLEALYSILSDWDSPHGGLRASSNKDLGQRYNSNARGVYFFEPKNGQRAFIFELETRMHLIH